MREVNDSQTLDWFKYILRNIGQVVMIKVDKLQLFGIFEGVKVQFVYPIIAQIQPLQMRHVSENITRGVLWKNLYLKHTKIDFKYLQRTISEL